MLDISTVSPYAAAVQFADDLLVALADNDRERIEALIDVNDTGLPLSQCLPEPDGFTYRKPAQFEDWSLHFVAVSENGFGFDFEIPFEGSEFRAMMARFTMKHLDDSMQVHFDAVVPT